MNDITSNRVVDPVTIVIFGATGDLSRKKLLPALLDLYVKKLLPDSFRIVGFSRKDLSHDAYRMFVKKVIAEKEHTHSESDITHFLTNVYYQQGLFEEASSYKALDNALSDLDKEFVSCPNRLLYLAVPPSLYDAIFEQLQSSGLSSEKEGLWTRVLVEKPFGCDTESARKLDAKLGELFDEHQIFRIDHYLAKAALQNIITFRFSNVLFENSWNSTFIDRVHIKLFENFGVEDRAAFYDGMGALRDVGQNHLLQMLALVAMDNPGALNAEALRLARKQVLSNLALYSPQVLSESVVRAQYEGYTRHGHVKEDSQTETYFLLKTEIVSDKWKGVPFYLESGKQLVETKTEISIFFKPPEACIYGDTNLNQHINVLTVGIKPSQDIAITLWSRKQGISFELEERELVLSHKQEETFLAVADAYEKVLFDSMCGDQMLFTSTEEVRAAWDFITPILETWESLPLEQYAKGSTGPYGKLDLIT